jgi:hypothetical protein
LEFIMSDQAPEKTDGVVQMTVDQLPRTARKIQAMVPDSLVVYIEAAAYRCWKLGAKMNPVISDGVREVLIKGAHHLPAPELYYCDYCEVWHGARWCFARNLEIG